MRTRDCWEIPPSPCHREAGGLHRLAGEPPPSHPWGCWLPLVGEGKGGEREGETEAEASRGNRSPFPVVETAVPQALS